MTFDPADHPEAFPAIAEQQSLDAAAAAVVLVDLATTARQLANAFADLQARLPALAAMAADLADKLEGKATR